MTGPFNPRFRIKSEYAAASAVITAPVIYFLPALINGRVLCPDDGLIQNVPFRVVAAQIIRSGHLPLWDPYIFSGMPLLAAAQAGVFFPLNWFYLLFSAPAATNLMVVSSYIVAALGAFLYARRTASSLAGAMITSLVWPFSGALIGQISHINIVHTSALLPWVLWSVEAYSQTASFKRGALLSALIAFQFFAGHQQTFLYSTMLIIAYALAMALVEVRRRKRYLASLVFLATGLLLAAVQILPTFELMRNSERATATYQFFTSFSMPKRFVLTLLAPFVLGGGDGRLFRAPYVGPPYYPEMVGYAGVLAIIFAIIAWLLMRDARTKFWAFVFVIGVLLAFGGYAPLHFYRLIYYMPILNLFRVPARHLMEVDFALAVLAGRGLTALTIARQRQSVLFRTAIASIGVLVLTILAVTAFRPAEFHLSREAPATILRSPELFMPILFAALSACALWLFARQRRAAMLFIFAVLALDLFVWGQSSGWYTASPKTSDEYWQIPQTVQLLRSFVPPDASSYRILTVPHEFDPNQPVISKSETGMSPSVLWTQPDVYMTHGIQNAAGYDGFGLARYQKLVGEMKVWGDLTDPETTLRGDSREIDLANARYLIAKRETAERVNATSAIDTLATASQEFAGIRFAAADLALPPITKEKVLSFVVPAVEIDRIALLTNLAWSESVPDNAVVARLRVKTSDGRQLEFPLRAGVDTAEWSYDRPDIRARIRHKRATVATDYEVNDAGGTYEGHTFVALISLPGRLKVNGGEIVLESDSRWPDLALSVSRISLISSAQGIAYALRREQLSVESSTSMKTTSTNNEAERWRLLGQTHDVQIYENAHALPRAWIVSDARVLDEKSMLEVIRLGRFADGTKWDPARTALIDSEIGEKSPPSANGQAEILGSEPNKIIVRTKSNTPAILVSSENHYSGWRTYLDGRAVETLRVDYNLRGALLPVGEHIVEFVYWPKSVLIGLLFSLVTALALVGAAIASSKKTSSFIQKQAL